MVCKQGRHGPHHEGRQHEGDGTAYTTIQSLVEINVILLSENIKMKSGCADDKAQCQDLVEDKSIVDTAQVPLTAKNKKLKKQV